MLNTKVNLHGTISAKNKMSGNLNSGIEKVYPPLENLEIVPSGEKQEFNHPNYYGYDKVTVENVKMQEKTVVPTAEENTIIPDEGYNGLKQVTVSGDSDLTPQNIKEGVNIFGVEGTAKVAGYEYAEFDPVNIIDLLDNDIEPYESKAVVLLVNQGVNSYDIKYSDRVYNSGDLIKFSDGGELTVTSSTQNYTFDESKDFVNSLGQRVRYFVAYKKSRTVSGSKPSYFNDIMMYYFKNCSLSVGSQEFFPTSNGVGKFAKFDDNCDMTSSTQNLGTNNQNIIEFELPDIFSVTNNSLYYALNSCYSLKKSKLNLNNVINNIGEVYGYCYSLVDVLLTNCPQEEVNCSRFLANCYSLKRFVAKPILKPANMSDPLMNCYALEILSGIDFANITSNWSWSGCRNLTTIENVANLNMNLNASYCVKLTHDSIMNLINALVDLTGQEAKTLNLGSTNLKKISEEEKAIATNKNWTLA